MLEDSRQRLVFWGAIHRRRKLLVKSPLFRCAHIQWMIIPRIYSLSCFIWIQDISERADEFQSYIWGRLRSGTYKLVQLCPPVSFPYVLILRALSDKYPADHCRVHFSSNPTSETHTLSFFGWQIVSQGHNWMFHIGFNRRERDSQYRSLLLSISLSLLS